MWLDDCRIPFIDEREDTTKGKYENKVQVGIMADRPNIKFVGSFDDSAKQGRFTPNLLVSDDMLNDGRISQAGEYKGEGSKSGGIWNKSTGKPAGKEYGDKGSNSQYYDLDLWFQKMIEKL